MQISRIEWIGAVIVTELNPTECIMIRALSDKTSKETRLEAGYWKRIKGNDALFSYKTEERL